MSPWFERYCQVSQVRESDPRTNEIDSPSERNIGCVNCGCKWHLICAQVNSSFEEWLCYWCLFHAAETTTDEDGDYPDKFPAGEASTSMSHVCTVCSDERIPVLGEHICTVCKNIVHAWCSNHEHITSSLNLVCNSCETISAKIWRCIWAAKYMHYTNFSAWVSTHLKYKDYIL